MRAGSPPRRGAFFKDTQRVRGFRVSWNAVGFRVHGFIKGFKGFGFPKGVPKDALRVQEEVFEGIRDIGLRVSFFVQSEGCRV